MDLTSLGKEYWDKDISSFGTLSKDSYRIIEERDQLRSPFSIDRDRILYSGAFRRYAGKTQVVYFSSQTDEQLSNRIIHTQFVSQIGRTIGSILGLNLDLIEAAALGHDLGHPPFGHDGERFLSKECQKYGIGYFHHNVHSLDIVDNISFGGKGMNLTFQVRDAIISHNGEINQRVCIPWQEKSEEDIKLYVDSMVNRGTATTEPQTLEGALIRQADTIAYIGSDIEDAIRLKIISRDQIPMRVKEGLGDNNSKIIDTLVNDIIRNSYNKNSIQYSDKIFEILKELKTFNYKYIYRSPQLKEATEKIKLGFEILFRKFMDDLDDNRVDSTIYKHFLDSRSENYKHSRSNPEKVRDFIASMTDRYFKQQLHEVVIP